MRAILILATTGAALLSACQPAAPVDSVSIVKSTKQAIEISPAQSEIVPAGKDRIALRQSIVVPVSVEEAWKYYTTEEGLRQWAAPVVQIDFAPGGKMFSNMRACGSIDDPDRIANRVVNFIPMKMLTLQADLDAMAKPEWMDPAMREEMRNLYNVVEFHQLDDRHTQIVSWGLGYPDDSDWREMIGFFVKGNEWTLNNLQKAIGGEVVDWTCASTAAG